jgi:hypothetical protein
VKSIHTSLAPQYPRGPADAWRKFVRELRPDMNMEGQMLEHLEDIIIKALLA